eukprot:TRINITY_DN1757_c0_g1_i1.p1 TRINITY_DN1757_c0_g1~~TRINITY_DN1757_c0_g1_i1.p1  ORF type:complete len:948 (-),score=252.28 TRINITY_DN1757_c0_g1_i1:465-3308(-)
MSGPMSPLAFLLLLVVSSLLVCSVHSKNRVNVNSSTQHTPRMQQQQQQQQQQRLRSSAIGKYQLLSSYNPIGNSGAIIVSGNARFTVLTDRLIRYEYSLASPPSFEDRQTLAIINRNFTVPNFQVANTTTGWLTITTDEIELNYKTGQEFAPNTLFITSTNSSTVFTNYSFGQLNSGNLLGTIRSLDELGVVSLNCTENEGIIIHNESLHCEWGIPSRQGWSVIDDSESWGMTDDFWWGSPNTDEVDQYFFGHGHDYKGALTDFVGLSGRIAMTPRYASGIWWSRWLNYNNFDVQQILSDYESRSVPLDVYILDMDWHTKQGWGGYTFDARLFPTPEATTDFLHAHGLPLAANIHDEDGVRVNEQAYADFVKYLGMNPGSTETIPFQICSNQSYALGLEDVVLAADEAQGMDFWWIDWQQGGAMGGCQGLKQNPTIWLNHLRATDKLRTNSSDVRGLILSRWGGYGSHRYQVGFSGDVDEVTWQNLAFQPYFSLTSSNVAYGYWSNDIVGPSDDNELYTRWLQWGAWSGVFRTHDRGMASGSCANDSPPDCAILKIWDMLDPYFSSARTAMQTRVQLVPYIYTAQREAYDTGVSLLRPMYYDYPEVEMAYAAGPTGDFGQYMFGDDLLVSPVTTQSNSSSLMSLKKIWIPEGVWIDTTTNTLMEGNALGTSVMNKQYDISEVPVFAKAGVVIPQIPLLPGQTLGLAAQQYSTLVFVVYPNATSGQATVYEDDGITTRYVDGAYVNTYAAYTRTSTTFQMKIWSEGNTYANFPSTRSYEVQIVNALPVTSGTVNGNNLSYSRFQSAAAGTDSWRYSGHDMTTIVNTQSYSTSSVVTITLSTSPIDDAAMSGLAGIVRHSILAKQDLDVAWLTPGSLTVNQGNISIVASAGEQLSYLAGVSPADFTSLLNSLPLLFRYAVEEVEGVTMYGGYEQTRVQYALELLHTAWR